MQQTESSQRGCQCTTCPKEQAEATQAEPKPRLPGSSKPVPRNRRGSERAREGLSLKRLTLTVGLQRNERIRRGSARAFGLGWVSTVEEPSHQAQLTNVGHVD